MSMVKVWVSYITCISEASVCINASIIGFGANLKVWEGRIMRVKRARGRIAPEEDEGVGWGIPLPRYFDPV